MRAWQNLGFSVLRWPIGRQSKDEMLIREAPSFLAADITVQNRIYYTKYWLTMVTGVDQPGIRAEAPTTGIREGGIHLDWGDIPGSDEEAG